MSKMKNAISPRRDEDYPEWYQQVVKASDLAEQSPVRGCMVIKPWGYALWENIQRTLDRKFKETGHKNAYFPLLIPVSFLEKEAKHVEGFAKECAVVTHHRLKSSKNGGLEPEGELEEPLVVRPTSETIIGEMFARWVKSYRDLPLLVNQWANIVRWEMRTRMFLRTTEFLWQEGHTVHSSAEEAMDETRRMLDVYVDFAERFLAMPVIKGEKTESERFPGATNTYCIEAMMQDGKALQAGTSHFLGQNFAKASEIKYLNQKGEQVYAWTTSWGVSTRLIGGVIMTHSDDDGLVLPPRLAPAHVVILPITFADNNPEKVVEYCNQLAEDLHSISYHDGAIEVEIDSRDIRGGEKVWSWIKKGVPIRLEIGHREVQENTVFMGRRDKGPKEKESIPRERFLNEIVRILDNMQQNLFEKAKAFRAAHMREIDTKEEFYEFFTPPSNNSGRSGTFYGGFALTHFSGHEETEHRIKEELGVSIRCIPFDQTKDSEGVCPFSGKPSKHRVVWARSY